MGFSKIEGGYFEKGIGLQVAILSHEADIKAFGALLKMRRKELGLTLEDLGEAAYSDRSRKSSISPIENGKNTGVTRATVRTLSLAVGIDPKDVPASLRWPEAVQVLSEESDTLDQVRISVDQLVSMEKDRVNEIGIKEETLRDLIEHYMTVGKNDVLTAIDKIEVAIGVAMTEKAEGAIPEDNSDRALNHILNSVEALRESGTSFIKRIVVVASATVFLLVSIPLLMLAFPKARQLVEVPFNDLIADWMYRTIQTLSNDNESGFIRSDLYFFPEGKDIIGDHKYLTWTNGQAYNSGKGWDSGYDSVKVNKWLDYCPTTPSKRLRNLDLRKVDLEEAKKQCGGSELFNNADFSSSLLRGRFDEGVALEAANFTGAFLINVDFGNSNVLHANFSCAAIDGADFSSVKGLSSDQLASAYCISPNLGLNLPQGFPVPPGCDWAVNIAKKYPRIEDSPGMRIDSYEVRKEKTPIVRKYYYECLRSQRSGG